MRAGFNWPALTLKTPLPQPRSIIWRSSGSWVYALAYSAPWSSASLSKHLVNSLGGYLHRRHPILQKAQLCELAGSLVMRTPSGAFLRQWRFGFTQVFFQTDSALMWISFTLLTPITWQPSGKNLAQLTQLPPNGGWSLVAASVPDQYSEGYHPWCLKLTRLHYWLRCKFFRPPRWEINESLIMVTSTWSFENQADRAPKKLSFKIRMCLPGSRFISSTWLIMYSSPASKLEAFHLNV